MSTFTLKWEQRIGPRGIPAEVCVDDWEILRAVFRRVIVTVDQTTVRKVSVRYHGSDSPVEHVLEIQDDPLDLTGRNRWDALNRWLGARWGGEPSDLCNVCGDELAPAPKNSHDPGPWLCRRCYTGRSDIRTRYPVHY